MTRVDLAIDYYNTNLKVEPLANKVTRTKKSSVVSTINRSGLTVMMTTLTGEAYAHE